MRSYRTLFRTPEFTPFLVSFAASSAALTIAGLALATLVFRATGSPLLSAISLVGPQLAQLVGATFLLSGADRLPPRAVLSGIALVHGVSTAVLAVPGMPVAGVFAVLFGQGLIASLGSGARSGLLTELLSRDGYVLGRSTFNMVGGLMQVAGFAAGGALLTLLTPRTCLLLASALHLASALITRFGLTARPPRSAGRLSASATWRTNALLWSARPRRLTYVALWVPNGLVVGCDSLFVSYDPEAAGTLFACGAAGMFVGDVLVGRVIPPAWRPRLAFPLRFLLGAPYLLFFFQPPVLPAAVAVAVAGVGFSASLVLQERLMSQTPDELAGQALGLHFVGMSAMQGVSAALGGTIAQVTSPAAAMTMLAAGSVTVTLTLVVLERRGTPVRRPAAGTTPDRRRPDRDPSAR